MALPIKWHTVCARIREHFFCLDCFSANSWIFCIMVHAGEGITGQIQQIKETQIFTNCVVLQKSLSCVDCVPIMEIRQNIVSLIQEFKGKFILIQIE